jgi:hypothetical protein
MVIIGRARVLAILFVAGTGCASGGGRASTADIPAAAAARLVTLDRSAPPPAEGVVPAHREFPAADAGPALAEALKGATDAQPLIVYVHGRAAGREPEPRKSLLSIVPQLERGYGARVVMFLWPGSDEGGGLGFPERAAREAAPDFARFVSGLASAREAGGRPLGRRPIVLLTHSLGSIVLDEYAAGYGPEVTGAGPRPPAKVFDVVVICSSASAAKTHAAWCSKLGFAGHVYVTVNGHDPILKLAGIRNLSGCLGKKLRTALAGDVDLAPNVEYVDLGAAGVDNHRYFLRGVQAPDSPVGAFLSKAMTGQAMDWSSLGQRVTREQRGGAVIFHLGPR